MKVFIADDHILIREGLKKILKCESDLDVVGDTGDAFEVAPFIRENEVDVLILDLNLPEKSGLEILKEVKVIKPSLHVLILSMNPEDRFATRTLKAGASGYITKESAPEELIKAIRKVSSGGKYVSQALAEKLAFDLDLSVKKSCQDLLSDREFEILRFIANGKSQTDIASDLSLSPSTVNTYRSRILDKLNLKTNADLIYYALQNKLVE
jgi:two-component system, NarL family, invasion response regulator UvrY